MVTIIGKPIARAHVIRRRKPCRPSYEYCAGHQWDGAYSWERKDCTVRALSIACEMPYAEAHCLLKNAGRRDTEGFLFIRWLVHHIARGSCVNGHSIRHEWNIVRPLTVNRLVKQKPKGKWLVSIKDHVFALVDGKIRDTYPVGGRTRVRGLYECVKQTS